MKNGYRIIDTDTHVGPNLETLEIYASARLRERWDELEQYKQPVTLGGHFLSISPMKYDRALGTPHQGEKATKGGESPLKRSVSKTFKTPPAPEVSNLNSTGRLADMDTEGVDVHVIIPGTFANAATALDAGTGDRAVRGLPPLCGRVLLGRHRSAEGHHPAAGPRSGGLG